MTAASAPARMLAARRSDSASEPPLRADELLALDRVSFDVAEGEIIGIVGANGAGKSTLLKVLSRITEPTEGRMRVRGRVGSLLEVGTGFHAELTGRENVFLNGAILGMRRSEITERLEEIVEFAEVARFIDTPVKYYSSGMYMRLAFSVAAHLRPDILIVDEVLAVGDVAFQQKCLGKMGEVSRQGRTVLLVSHNMSAVLSLCTRAIMLHKGRIEHEGDPSLVTTRYKQVLADGALSSGSEAGAWTASEATGRGAHITRIEMVDPDTGERKPTLATGDAVSFRLHYRSDVEFSGAGFQLTVSSSDSSVPLIAARTDADLVATPLSEGATGYLECVFPSFPLAASRADRYLVGVYIYDPRTGEALYDGTIFGELVVEPRERPGRRYPVDTGASWLAADYDWVLDGFTVVDEQGESPRHGDELLTEVTE